MSSIAKRVMIVEDDMLLSMVEERLIRRLGFDVVGKLTRGEDVSNKICEHKPDILIMDIQLAGKMDGIDAVREARKTYKNIPVIFLSGSRNVDLLDRAKRVGYSDYLVKPVNADDLASPLAKAARASGSPTFEAA
ncbi:MAG: response regulator [Bacteroidota bacterium]